jgi:hypothetical protein
MIRFRISIAVFGTLLLGSLAQAQTNQASLSGTIKDRSGSVISGAVVTLRNKGTAQVRTTTTGTSGGYVIPNMDPADYSLTINFPGFATLDVANLTLHTGERATFDGTLELGARRRL